MEQRAYDLKGDIFGNTNSILEELETSYSDSTYICEAMDESIYTFSEALTNHDILSHALQLNDYVNREISEEAIAGCEDLCDILKLGVYEYYRSIAYLNLSTILFNRACTYLEEKCTSEVLEQIDEYDIDFIVNRVSSGDRYWMIDSKLDQLIDSLQEDEDEDE